MWKQLSKRLGGIWRLIRAHWKHMTDRVKQWLKETDLLNALKEIVKKNQALAVLGALGLMCSLVGYLIVGHPFFRSLYAAAALFFVNPVEEESNLLIMLGKFFSLAVAAGVILNVVKYAFRLAGHFTVNLHDDSTAVYTDNPWGERLAEGLKHGYISKEKAGDLENAKHHIFMYADEDRNLKLYAEHREALRDRKAYIMLSQVDAFLLNRENRSGGPHCFNVYDLLARDYWIGHSLFKAVCVAGEKPVKVAVVGYGPVGQAICKYAVLNNVYRLGQSIEYHVWGCKPYQAAFLKGIDLMLGDKFVIHDGDPLEALETLAGMDRVILTLEESTELLQQLLYAAPAAELHCYSDQQRDLDALYAHTGGELVSFGSLEGFLTEENIKQEALYRDAMLLNYDYVLQSRGYPVNQLPPRYREEMLAAWQELDGFLKGSNIARADHIAIKRSLHDRQLDGEIGPLEHIRWCRFHFYNHWSFGPELVDAEVKKDKLNRRHGLLTLQVPLEEQGKDRVQNSLIRDMLGVGKL